MTGSRDPGEPVSAGESHNERMDGDGMKPHESTGEAFPAPLHAAGATELLLGLSPAEWSALEAVSRRRNLSMAQAARRAVAEFLRRESEADNWGVADEAT